MGDFDFLVAVGLFFGYFLIDALYTLYTLSVMEYKAARAATMGAFMYIVIAFGTISYVKSYWYVIPIGVGSWLGTYVTIKYKSKGRAIGDSKAPAAGKAAGEAHES